MKNNPNNKNIRDGYVNKTACWGRNDDGQTDIPSSVLSSANMVRARFNSCVIHTGIVKCWGNNEYGINDIPKLFKNGDSGGHDNLNANMSKDSELKDNDNVNDNPEANCTGNQYTGTD